MRKQLLCLLTPFAGLAGILTMPAWGHVSDEQMDELIEAARPDVVEVTNTVTRVEREEVPVEVVREVPAAIEGVESITFAYTFRDDGSCADPGHIVSGELLAKYEQLGLDVSAYARTAPSGGDCRVDTLSYNLSIEQSAFSFGAWDAVAIFGADKRSTSAGYAIVDAMGNVLVRPDGRASDPVVLPAGAAETVTAAMTLCRDIGSVNVNLCAGVNVVPVDWADGSTGRTAHFRATVALPYNVNLDVTVDAGADQFGDLALRWSKGPLHVALRQAFGLNATDDGTPEMQTFAGLPVVKTGAPQSTATLLEVGVRLR